MSSISSLTYVRFYIRTPTSVIILFSTGYKTHVKIPITARATEFVAQLIIIINYLFVIIIILKKCSFVMTSRSATPRGTYQLFKNAFDLKSKVF